jgi:hypothetical protein
LTSPKIIHLQRLGCGTLNALREPLPLKAVFFNRGRDFMHLVKEHIHEMAQEGAKLTNEERLHLKQCEECAGLFRMFVLHRFYTQREHLLVECVPVQ